jgi:hypothetical protein
MQARAAYIRSFGTTGILLTAALLMLAVVGTVVSFHRWPSGEGGQQVQSVPLQPAATRNLHVVRTAAAVHKTDLVRKARIVGDSSSTAGLVKEVGATAPEAVGYPVAISPGHVGSTVGSPSAPAPASGGGVTTPGQPRPPAPPQAPSAPNLDPQSLQTLVDEIVGSIPPPQQSSQDGSPLQIHLHVPLTGTEISTPPGN